MATRGFTRASEARQAQELTREHGGPHPLHTHGAVWVKGASVCPGPYGTRNSLPRTCKGRAQARLKSPYDRNSPPRPMTASRMMSTEKRSSLKLKQLKMFSPLKRGERAVWPLISVDSLNTTPYSLQKGGRKGNGGREDKTKQVKWRRRRRSRTGYFLRPNIYCS